MPCQNPHPLIDPSSPLVGEVVLRETLSHRPALLCASHGAYAPWVAAVFDFVIRLASHPFMHPLLQAVGGGNSEAVCFVGCLVKILTTIRLLRYLTSSSALHPILLCIPFSKLLGGVIWGGLLREMLFHWTCASLGFAWGYCVKNLIENEKKD